VRNRNIRFAISVGIVGLTNPELHKHINANNREYSRNRNNRITTEGVLKEITFI